jgi:hypothetical protein
VSVGDGGTEAARRVLALAHAEQALVAAGAAEELDELHQRRRQAMAQLPARLAPQARAALQEALGVQQGITASLGTAVAAAADELGRVGHGRTAMRGYTPAGLDARRVLDQSA